MLMHKHNGTETVHILVMNIALNGMLLNVTDPVENGLCQGKCSTS